MRLKNVLIVVNDIAYSKAFYKDLFGLDSCVYPIEYVNPLMQHDWGQRVIRIYDPDRHVIEIGESIKKY